MKILEPGNPDGTWTRGVICTNAGNGNAGCGAKLEIVGADIFKTVSYSIGDKETCFTITCPCCEKWTDISTAGIPSGIQTRVYNLEEVRPA